MLNAIWDMETQDPDDFLTLLLLLGHPKVNLKAITITPGSRDQVGLVRKALSWFERDVPVGAFNLEHPKSCVSQWHYSAYGNAPPSDDAESGPELLMRLCDESTTLITGAALKNLGGALRRAEDSFCLGRLVAQGGFAGEGVVSSEKHLPKFRGLTTCPTFNLNGDSKSALLALASPHIHERRFVSKNVCHGVIYDQTLHEKFAAVKDQSLSLELIYKGMERYLRKSPAGKKFHDPLAACCAIEEQIGTWSEVELYREKGEWGSRLMADTRTWIITEYDPERFVQVLTSHP